jgi:glycosyltransferase involved in cell wall biosynthesis
LLAKSDAGADVADAIYEIWQDPARAAEMGRRGADGVRQHYTVARMAERVLDIYNETVSRGAGSFLSAEAQRAKAEDPA